MNENSTNRPPQEKVCAYEYTVKRGDSFYLIAHRLGVPLRDLLEANSDINPARLMVGDVLCIPMEEDDRVTEPTPSVPSVPPTAPTPSTPSAPPAPQVPQTPTTPSMPSTPSTPQTPTVPSTPVVPPTAPEMNQPARPGGEADHNMAVCPEADRHAVREGETISDIQMKAGLNLHTLELANPNVDLEALTAGQVLCVPDTNIPCAMTTYTLRTDETLERAALRLNVSVGALLRANPCLAPADFTAGVCITVPRRGD